MAELTTEQKQAINDYLSKEVALSPTEQKAIEDYLSKRTDLSLADKSAINGYLRKVVISIVGILGIGTGLAFVTAWNNLYKSVETRAFTSVSTNLDTRVNSLLNTQQQLLTNTVNQALVDIGSVQDDIAEAKQNVVNAQDNIKAIEVADLTQLGASIKEFQATLGEQNDEEKTALDVVSELETRIAALENREVTFQTGYIEKLPESEPLGDGWTAITAPDGSKTFTVKFDEPFNEKPKVIVSPVQIENYGSRAGMFYAIRMSQDSVISEGFSFSVDGAKSDSFSNLRIQWFAVGYKSK